MSAAPANTATTPTLRAVTSPRDASVPVPRFSTWDHILRTEQAEETPEIIPTLIWAGLNVLFAPPGGRKTWVGLEWAQWLGHGVPMNGFGAPEERVPVLIMDAESSKWLLQSRSFAIAKPGTLATDDPSCSWDGVGGIKYTTDEEGVPGMPGNNVTDRFLYLQAELDEAAERGRPIRLAIVDTLRAFIGNPQQGVSRDAHEGHWTVELNRLGDKYGCAIVALHHTNKSGEFSGATTLSGGVVTMLRLARKGDSKEEMVLAHEKNRYGPEVEYALLVGDDGVPRFTDQIIPSQARSTGTARKVLDCLVREPMTMADLQSAGHGLDPEAVKTAVRRLKGKGMVEFNRGVAERGKYSVVVDTPLPQAPPPCSVCSLEMVVISPGQTTHPGCDSVQEAPAVVPSAGDDEGQDAIVGSWNASIALRESVERSTKHPILKMVVQAELEQHRSGRWDATASPWNLVHERMDGQHHKWVNPVHVPSGRRIAIMDRRKSYLATASGVAVAPSTLQHTGRIELEQLRERAGLFRIEPVDWPHLAQIAHPMGWTATEAADESGNVLVTSPHLEHLVKLHRQGHISDAPVIVDSWTGVRVTNLFRPFGEAAKRVLDSGDADSIGALKEGYSKAIRGLWPKYQFTDFWRPDWLMAFEAEASVRNWAQAWKAVQAGETLLRIANTDATEWLMPEGAADDWIPETYTAGTGFGQGHHKDDVPVYVLDAKGQRVRGERNVAKTHLVTSPLSIGDYMRYTGKGRINV